MFLLYHAYVYLEFLILACTIYILAPKRVNKRGIEYGWDVAVYSSIEHIYGYDYVTSCYKDNPQDSWKQIVDYMHEMYPEATDKQIRKLLK